jgi:hypothetical protein
MNFAAVPVDFATTVVPRQPPTSSKPEQEAERALEGETMEIVRIEIDSAGNLLIEHPVTSWIAKLMRQKFNFAVS